MKSITSSDWEKVKKNPTESFKRFFIREKEFLEKNISENSLILDIGCGAGDIDKFLSDKVRKIVSIDNDKDALDKFKLNTKNNPNIEILFMDAENLRFGEETFDIIIMMGTTFCNLGNTKNKILSEIKRVLKVNGFFIFSIYNEDALDKRLEIYKKYWKGFQQKNGTIFYKDIISEQFSKEEITDILEDAGFRINEITKGEIFYLIKASKT